MDALMTVEDIAEYLKVSLRTVYNLSKSGKLPSVRVGDSLRFRKSDIDDSLSISATDLKYFLVIDDSPLVCELVKKTLDSNTRMVFAANSGPEALEQMESIKFDHVFLDLVMPGMSGVETLRKIREIDGIVKVSIITCFPEKELAAEVKELGIDHVIIKPFRPQEILSALSMPPEQQKAGSAR